MHLESKRHENFKRSCSEKKNKIKEVVAFKIALSARDLQWIIDIKAFSEFY